MSCHVPAKRLLCLPLSHSSIFLSWPSQAYYAALLPAFEPQSLFRQQPYGRALAYDYAEGRIHRHHKADSAIITPTPLSPAGSSSDCAPWPYIAGAVMERKPSHCFPGYVDDSLFSTAPLGSRVAPNTHFYGSTQDQSGRDLNHPSLAQTVQCLSICSPPQLPAGNPTFGKGWNLGTCTVRPMSPELLSRSDRESRHASETRSPPHDTQPGPLRGLALARGYAAY
ncbi:hypothetical protein MAPG_10375 [Magnaporthiopsis poae ATCC 64411]|uniref:Uncharacterized protein n=1 Tax=Magnaporthiopsis poae (strain ATCC 64411 / 73-15) TaxID=644358 RepID=A0A0C4ECF1_MAGP6|nr:hypothetical protein MAPG_10375 [Magnaporthiopsis poae ATCC 64411]